jgi:hypothetical protein
VVFSEFRNCIFPLNLTLQQIEPILVRLKCKVPEYRKLTRGTIYYDQWPRFVRTGRDWVKMLRNSPKDTEVLEKIDWTMLRPDDWAFLIDKYPQYIDQCTCFEQISGTMWGVLLHKYPQIVDKCPWYKITEKNWLYITSIRPYYLAYSHLYNKSRDDHYNYMLSYKQKYQKMLSLKRQPIVNNQLKLQPVLPEPKIVREQTNISRPQIMQLDI